MVAAMSDATVKLPPLPVFAPGSVWLAGAGPGDPGLLTLLALHALGQADVVVYDALVDPRILKLARPAAALENAGKRGGRPSPKQPDISARLVEFARAGKRVLRLKGGDPFVFGRGGEEALALVAAKIPFRIVPGITAGVGGLAYAGIPSTHRDINSAVAFVTGHTSSGTVPDGLDWQALAKGAPVLVIYMALGHLKEIAERLIESGRPAGQPVAIISQATTDNQRVLESTLGSCAEAARSAALEPPAMLVVGDVVRLRSGLDWLGAAQGKALDPDPLRSKVT
jgi:uroporphyrin-III C-methyltransferase